MNTNQPAARRPCTHWLFTATPVGRRVRFRCLLPGCRYRWRRTPTTTATAGSAAAAA